MGKQEVWRTEVRNSVAQMLRSTKPYMCSHCHAGITDKYVIYDNGKFYHLKCFPATRKNPVGDLYESFHGTPPLRTRKVLYEPPRGTLVKVGMISQLNYIPEYPSKKMGTEFYHVSGDTGEKTLKSNLILATDSSGRNLYLLKDKKAKRPFFSERGIIG